MLSPFLNIVNPSVACDSMPHATAMEFKFPLDPFQQHAIAAISRDENVLVTAKTGSGKTLVGEYQIAHSLAKGGRVFYTTPIKSLSNQKFHDLKSMFPSVGIMTGDLKFRPDADIVIMTTEILRNLLFKANSAATRQLGITADLSLDRLDAVVFDECHYINDRDRGAVWEETMILLPRSVNLVMLSATIDAPELFGSWLGELKQKPIHLISTTYRIVPLQHGVYRGSGEAAELLTVMDSKDRFEAGLYKAWLLWRAGQGKAADDHRARVADRRRGGYEDGPVARGAAGLKSFKHQMNELVARLEEKELLPALFFVFSRKDCERYAAAVEHTLIDSSDTASVKHILDFHLHRYGEELTRMPQYQTLRSLLERGIAFHHSGLLPVMKEVIEVLFGRGFIKLLFATETFAVGINMPTKTVVFTSYRKYDDATGGMRMLNTDEYIQMAGRAGRRGKDDKGLVLYLPDRDPEDLEDVKRMMCGARATFQSRMTFHYNFLLKTLLNNGEGSASAPTWHDIMRKSYWFCKEQRYWEQSKRDLERLDAEQKALGITDAELDALQEREELLAALQNSQNAARKKAQSAWGTWENQHQGPRWIRLVKELGPQWKKLNRELATLEADAAAAANYTASTWARLKELVSFGFLEPFSEPSGEAPTPLKLTPLGIAATEVNEGHEIIMPLAYKERLLKGLGPEELVTVLASFLGGGDTRDQPHPDSLDAPAPVRDCLVQLQGLADRCEAKGHAPKDGYWSIDTTWVDPVWHWLSGADMTEICADFGCYEGNFMRALLKMVNLLEEWRSLATLATDTETLELLRGMEQKLLRGVAVCDSLYLRI
jgi:superfamily II RNA helicase